MLKNSQEKEQVYSYNPGAHTGLPKGRLAEHSLTWTDLEKNRPV